MLVFISINFKFYNVGLLSKVINSSQLNLAYISFLCTGFLYITLLRVFFELVNTLCLIVIILFYIFHTRLEQVWVHLHEGKIAFFSELRFRLHYRYIVDSMLFLADFNLLYGKILFTFLLFFYPENATMWIVVLFNKEPLSLLFRSIFVTCAFIGISFAMAIHYKVISLTARMSDSGKYLASVTVCSKNIRSLRCQIKLDRYISLFHSETRPHTVSYGRHGNVTANSFCKVKNEKIVVIRK